MTNGSAFVRRLEAIDMAFDPADPRTHERLSSMIRDAIAIGDEDIEYEARLRQAIAAYHAGDSATSLTSFTWCLARHDADPLRFPAVTGAGWDLLGLYCVMPHLLVRSSAYGATELEAALDDLERRYRWSGRHLRPVLAARFRAAWESGDNASADRLRVELESTPADPTDPNEPFLHTLMANFLMTQDRATEAIPHLNAAASTAEDLDTEIQALSTLMLALLIVGDAGAARATYEKYDALLPRHPDQMAMAWSGIWFCGVTGNDRTAIRLVEKNLRHLGEYRLRTTGHIHALSAIGVALDAATENGLGGTVVRGADAPRLRPLFGAHDGPWTVEELASSAWEAALRLARQQDESSGNDTLHAEVVAERALRERYDVPLDS